MWKAILAGTTALTLIGSSLAYAQDNTPARAGGATEQHHPRTAEERAASTDARISDLKADLHLSVAQEKNWSAFEAALRDTAKIREARFEQFRKAREDNAAQPRARADFKAAAEADQKRLAAALDPLYKSLDEGQKQRFAAKFDVNGEGRHFWFKRERHSENESH
ncbi:MAG TPA: Spy/CpxP family protein refolding chaperone [Xanthobacteraceae bacterium]|nr:Spy/CpxP family protein refolding chaperone [Xanthobacteraceae bacterium]